MGGALQLQELYKVLCGKYNGTCESHKMFNTTWTTFVLPYLSTF